VKLPPSVHREWASFDAFGETTILSEWHHGDLAIPVYTNEFWTSRQRAGHSLHEVSYRACYKPQLPAFFVERFTRPGDLVHDPFLGRGTTVIEARLHGRAIAGTDANPVSERLILGRLRPPPLTPIRERLRDACLPEPEEEREDLLAFFHPDTLREILGWKAWLRQRRDQGAFDDTDAWIEMVALNRLTGHSPGFFSVYTLPPNQATSVERQWKINAKRGQAPPYRDTRRIMEKKSRSLLADRIPDGYGALPFRIHTGSADHTPWLADNCVALVVTSPPFLNVVNYLSDNWMRNWFCGEDPPVSAVWQTGSLSAWLGLMGATFRELHRVLRPGGLVAFEVGEVRRGTLPLDQELAGVALENGLHPLALLINAQEFTKTAHCWGVANNKGGTNTNRILLLGKPEG
jgi:hypothetical protein